MAFRHLLRRVSPDLDRRWVIGLLIVGALILAATFVRWGESSVPLELVALGPEGRFVEEVAIPEEWMDTTTVVPDAVVRAPLILGVRNPGRRPVTPAELDLSLPERYRLTGTAGRPLEPRIEAGSPLITYTLRPRFRAIEPQRLPDLLPGHDTLWLEVVVPQYYCVSLADSIPEFVSAPPPTAQSLGSLRIFYSFAGGDLPTRQTGTLDVSLDTSLIELEQRPDPQGFPMEADPQLAQPDLGMLTSVGSRRSRCGEPEAPMELLSTVWEMEDGGRFIALDYGGRVRKHLYDFDGDGVIDRESWDPSGEGEFTATRRSNMPIPEFLLPREPTRFDMARIDSLPPDSQAALDPFRRAMRGPGEPPGGRAPPDTVEEADTAPPAPQPRRPRGPLGRPIDGD